MLLPSKIISFMERLLFALYTDSIYFSTKVPRFQSASHSKSGRCWASPALKYDLCAVPLCAAGDIGQLDARRLQLIADTVRLSKILRLLRLIPGADFRFNIRILLAGLGDDVVVSAALLRAGSLLACLVCLLEKIETQDLVEIVQQIELCRV